jgi:hypothetical protein
MKHGVIAEVARAEDLFPAIHALRDRGLTRLQAFTPYPIDGLDRALGSRRSPVSIITAAGGLFGVVGGYFLQWLLDACLYPVNSGGRPPHMPLAFVPITIEMGFLFGGLAAFFAALGLGRLVRLWTPVMEVPGIESATRAGFWIAVDADDPRYAVELVEADLLRTGAIQITTFGSAV